MVVSTGRKDPPGLGARSAAQAVLQDILRKRRPLDSALSELIPAHLSDRDAGFARAIIGETLRRIGQIDAILRTFVRKAPQPHRAGATMEILLAGTCELLFLDVPPHAAVDAANQLAARDEKAVHFKPLINATLRRMSREGAGLLAALDAERTNTADWLWGRWCEFYGEPMTREIARIHAQRPPLDITMKSHGATDTIGAHGRLIADGAWRLPAAGPVEELPGFREGEWWVQDFAASLPARLFGDVKGKTVIDLCAAPGGKTAQLAAAGAHVVAVERDPQRLARVHENLERLRLHADLVEADVLDYVPAERAPFVLLDAPCSATGTIRRHPELPWIKNASDVNACSQSAAELLDAAAEMVAPGGTLVFAVCSLEEEECRGQIAAFLRRNAKFRRDALCASDVFGMSPLISEDGDLRTLPCHLAELGGMDGFYAARLKCSG